MSDHMIPVEKIREMIEAYRGHEQECVHDAKVIESEEVRTASRARAVLYRAVISDLKELLPQKTMSDLTATEGMDSRWMQAKTIHGEIAVIIKISNARTNLLFMDGRTEWRPNDTVIPLPNEPRAELPWYTGPF